MKKIIFAFLLLITAGSKAQKTDADFSERSGREKNLQENIAAAKAQPAKSFQQNLAAANKGSKKAMYATGMNYKHGSGTPVDNTEALKWIIRAADSNYAPANFKLGEMYKFGELVPMNYEKSYTYFSKAVLNNYPPAFYSKGYMLHKGLGCTQNYTEATMLFKKGAYIKYAPAMYMLGVSYRNGFGILANADSANYWLTLAAKRGYKFAEEELQTSSPENNPSAIELVKNIEAAKKHTAPRANPINQYTKIPTGIPASELEGSYEGYLLKYDWSGKQVIDVTKLTLQIKYSEGKIIGNWVESDSNINLQFTSLLTKNGLLFQDMQYRKADHYNKAHPLLYNFEKASLQLLKDNNIFYLSGNLHLFSPESKEPEKPFSIALIRIKKGNGNGEINFVNEDGLLIKSKDNFIAYPNPFTDIINIEFDLKKQAKVYTQLLTVDGKIVLTTAPAVLSPGKYILPLKPNVVSGTYMVRLITGNQVQSAQLVKIK